MKFNIVIISLAGTGHWALAGWSFWLFKRNKIQEAEIDHFLVQCLKKQLFLLIYWTGQVCEHHQLLANVSAEATGTNRGSQDKKSS